MFSFYGAKWRLAPKYPAPIYDRIVEPFAGSAQYSLLYPDKKIVLVDRDPIIVAVWRYLFRVTQSEILSLPTVFDGSVDQLPICQEARWLIGFWLNNAVPTPCKTMSKWGRNGGTSFWGRNIQYRIASQLQFIRHWRIYHNEYKDIPNIKATWFVDPPYNNKAGQRYRWGSKKIDFAHLGKWCRQRKGQAIVCENEGATWLPFEPLMLTQNAAGKGYAAAPKRTHEAIWIGGQ